MRFMTNTNEILLDVQTTPDAEIATKISRTLIESAWVLTTLVRAQACDLKALDDARRASGADDDEKKKTTANAGAATRELVSLVLAATRTMEMKHKIDAVAGPADKLTRDEARKLLELTDAQIEEFILKRRAAAEGKSRDLGVAGDGPVLLAGTRA